MKNWVGVFKNSLLKIKLSVLKASSREEEKLDLNTQKDLLAYANRYIFFEGFYCNWTWYVSVSLVKFETVFGD